MLQLVRQLNARFTRKAAKPNAIEPVPASGVPLPRKPGTSSQRWSESEARLLLQWELEHRAVQAELPDIHHSYQTLIVGVDLVNNQLLLDALFPAPPASHLFADQPFWLTLPLASGDYRICVQARDLMPGRELLVDIITTHFAARSAEVREMVFIDNRSPQAQLWLSSGQSISGRLRTLSTGGATLAVPASLAREQAVSGDDAECAINFNERFAIRCAAKLARVHRVNGTSLLQLEFKALDTVNASHLDAYIRACEARQG